MCAGAHTVCMESGAARLCRRLGAALRAFSAHRVTSVAGMLAFFLIMSLVPFSFWLTMLLGGTGLPEQLLSLELFGWARDFLQFLSENAAGATAGASVVLLAASFWSSSSFFYHLRRSGELVYGVRRIGRGRRTRLSALAFTLAVMLLSAAVGGAFVGAAVFFRRLPPWAGYPLLYAALLVLGFLAAWLLNIYACPVPGCARRLAAGSFFTALAWLGASAIFSVYLSFGNKQALYGALTLVIVFFLWLYWLMICFVAGIVFNVYQIRPECILCRNAFRS